MPTGIAEINSAINAFNARISPEEIEANKQALVIENITMKVANKT
jgi:hypothetical protein